MITNTHVSTHVLSRFDKIPLYMDGDVYRPEETVLATYFEALSDSGFTNWQPLKESLLRLRFTKEEIEDKVNDNVPIPSYEQWKKEFAYYTLNQKYRVAQDEDLTKQVSTKSTSKRIVLNKRNPFADVEIKDQAFLYPSKSGYDMLAFTTNRHLVRREYNDKEVNAVIPGFKVSRQKNRERVDTIIASDSVSTPLPEVQDEVQLVYI